MTSKKAEPKYLGAESSENSILIGGEKVGSYVYLTLDEEGTIVAIFPFNEDDEAGARTAYDLSERLTKGTYNSYGGIRVTNEGPPEARPSEGPPEAPRPSEGPPEAPSFSESLNGIPKRELEAAIEFYFYESVAITNSVAIAKFSESLDRNDLIRLLESIYPKGEAREYVLEELREVLPEIKLRKTLVSELRDGDAVELLIRPRTVFVGKYKKEGFPESYYAPVTISENVSVLTIDPKDELVGGIVLEIREKKNELTPYILSPEKRRYYDSKFEELFLRPIFSDPSLPIFE